MATIRDIAGRLGLTASTVSHALNERPGKVGAETRRRIFEVAAELGYAPNPAARALVAPGRTGNVGLVSRRYNNALYAAVLEAVAVAVDARGGNLVTCVTDRTGEHHGQERLLHAGSIDGLLAVPGALPGLDAPESPWMRKPIVFLLAAPDDARAAGVGFDEAGGVRSVVAHLRERGHRRMLFLQGLGVDGGVSSIGRARLALLRDEWARSGGETVLDSAGTATAAGGRAAMLAALDRGDAFTATVAYNDQMAVGALRALADRGLSCPGDVALVGWNDLDDVAAHVTPAALTSVRLSPAALAAAALDLLYRQIDAPPAERRSLVPASTHVSVPVELTVRDSTEGNAAR